MADREAFDAYVRERWAPLLRTATPVSYTHLTLPTILLV